MYLGWAYVCNRLLSASVEYEETGWYDGQVKPVMSRLKLPREAVGITGVYHDDSAESFEPEAFCGEPQPDLH